MLARCYPASHDIDFSAKTRFPASDRPQDVCLLSQRRWRGLLTGATMFNLGLRLGEARCRKQPIRASACRRSTFISTVK
jgi:hypothetical protein